MTLLGWSVPEGINERFKLSEISEIFSLKKVNKASAKFDWEKLNWLNSQVIHEMSPEHLLKKINPLFLENGWHLPSQEWGIHLSRLIGPSMVLLNDGVTQAKAFFEEPELSDDGKKQLEKKEAKLILNFILEKLESLDSALFSKEEALDVINQASKTCEVKKGLVMKSLRAALFGTLNGPDLIQSWILLSRFSKDRTRISRFI
tara:strand:- start:313 stop:921 length:609 start_codon:yes stop_codon:yes gene_type:complete